ncbi:glutamate--tRNA ligase-like isoform X2 [Halichondria panicea]|uniref:glutamate--tRNA ligase-like isoform X2 n=1 Tax=Halichondria panicea TaxID=6063 RepID=UPI00312B2B22
MVRVRFAPSPTGLLHLGGVRTALYNLLFARANQGATILRLEDTDQDRYVSGSIEKLEQSLKWLKLNFEEGPTVGGIYGPYVQSERLTHYRDAASSLLHSGAAYRCFCSKERLSSLRSQGVGYDGHCRGLSQREGEERGKQGVHHTIRLKVPTAGDTVIQDIVYGEVTVQHSAVEDQVLLKSDGYPTYHLANVVDDHLMEITHVLRGEEWLLSTAKHLLLYSAMEWEPPRFVHLPLLLSSSGGKLSKRNKAAFVETYQERGFLPEAVLNFVALLGWSPPTTELLTLDDMIQLFSLKDLNKKGSMVDENKLLWLNKQHFKRKLENREELVALVDQLQQCVKSCYAGILGDGDFKLSKGYLEKVLLLLEDRVSLVPAIPKEASFFWVDPNYSTTDLSTHSANAVLKSIVLLITKQSALS